MANWSCELGIKLHTESKNYYRSDVHVYLSCKISLYNVAFFGYQLQDIHVCYVPMFETVCVCYLI